MMSQTGQKIITIHILSIICRSKGNQAMELGLLIKYSASNLFLQQSRIK